MSIETVFEFIDLLRCPVCGAAFSRCGASLRCENGHTFDVSRKGYVHFAPNVNPSRYGAALFEARRRVLEAGFYGAVIDAIQTAMPQTAEVILDAGCGDGTFTKALAKGTTIGADLSKDAILSAARGGGPILWAVADLTNLPVKDASCDVILNLFSPAHYMEFARVLKPEGRLLKLVPQEGYLKEIRSLMGERLRRETYSNEAVVQHLRERFTLLDRVRVTNTFPLNREQAQDFLQMTPLTFGMEPEALDAERLSSITIDAELLVAAQ